MSVTFSEVIIQNNNGLSIEVKLEIPIGNLFKTVLIAPQSSESISVKLTSIQSFKIISKDSGHMGMTDQMVIDLSKTGNPYNLYIEKIETAMNIGRIRGKVSTQF